MAAWRPPAAFTGGAWGAVSDHAVDKRCAEALAASASVPCNFTLYRTAVLEDGLGSGILRLKP